MKKILILIVVFIIFSFIVFMFVMQDYLFPATYAAAVDQSLWGSIPNYGGQVVIWASSMETGGAGYDGMIFVGSVGFDGYEGPLSFLCGNLVQDTVTYITDCFGTLRECTGGPCPHTGIDVGTNYQEGFPVQTPFGGKLSQSAHTGVGAILLPSRTMDTRSFYRIFQASMWRLETLSKLETLLVFREGNTPARTAKAQRDHIYILKSGNAGKTAMAKFVVTPLTRSQQYFPVNRIFAIGLAL